ncbi:hypothetical protein KM043_014327 [Ampulex compressa]|nr:hypothetical protein KM043_014327 [Ampulex compressa]
METILAILFYGSDFRVEDLPYRRLKHVEWGLLHEESPRNNPIFVHEEALNLFNYSSTFSRKSNVPLTLSHLIGLRDLSALTYFVPTKVKNELIKKKNYAPLLYIQSDCNTASNRDAYVSELMKYIKIDSYGACLKNANLEERLSTDYLSKLNADEFLSFVAGYKFTIAFENAVCEDYVTEKLWRPLVVGSVPIYYGSPTFQDWLPNNKSAISVVDFSGPEALAEFLYPLLCNDTEYERYLSHKLSPADHRISNSFLLEELKEQPHKDFGEEIDWRNFWVDQWIFESCTAKLLNFYARNNHNFNTTEIQEQRLNLYSSNRCMVH